MSLCKTNRLRFPEFDTVDLACAAENMLREITSLGLRSVWLSVMPIKERIKKVDRILGIPLTLVRTGSHSDLF